MTGVYRQVRGPYWDDQVLTGLSGSVGTQPPYRPMHDTWLTAAATFAGPGAPAWLDPVNSVTFDLDRRTVGVDQLVRTGALVTAMAESASPQVDDLGESGQRTRTPCSPTCSRGCRRSARRSSAAGGRPWSPCRC